MTRTRSLFFAYLSLAGLSLCGYAQQAGDSRPSIAIIPCKVGEGVTVTEGSFITERVTLEILRNGSYAVIDKYEIKKRLAQSQEMEDTCQSYNCYFDIGKRLETTYALWGNLSRKGQSLQIELRLGDIAAKQLKNTVSSAIVGSTIELAEQVPQLVAALLGPRAPAPAAGPGGAAPAISVFTPPAPPKPVKLTVKSIPPGASVLLNGEEAGTTPFTKDSLEPGSYDLTLGLRGYKKFSQQLALKPNQDKNILVHLCYAFGSLTVLSKPDTATYDLSGKMTGVTPFSCDSLDPGTYTLRVSKDLYVPSSQQLYVINGQKDTVMVNLLSVRYVDSLKRIKRIKNQWVRRIAFGIGTGTMYGFGLYDNMKASQALDREAAAYEEYQRLNSSSTTEEFTQKYTECQKNHRDADKAMSARNVLYVLGSVSALGLGISIWF